MPTKHTHTALQAVNYKANPDAAGLEEVRKGAGLSPSPKVAENLVNKGYIKKGGPKVKG